MKTRCPNCQQIMDVTADTNGLKLKCPGCAKIFTVYPAANISEKNTVKIIILSVLITLFVAGIAGGATFYFIKYKPFAAKKQEKNKAEVKKHQFSYAAVEVFNLPNGMKLEMIKTPRGDYIGKYEVTQGQWKAMMGTDIYQQKAKAEAQAEADIKLKLRGVGDRKPMYYVNCYDALQFCNELNYKGYAPSGWKFTLPESNWYIYYGLKKLSKAYLDYDYSSIKMTCIQGETTEVGSVSNKNELGLYDVWGNVTEWTTESSDDDYVIRRQWKNCDIENCRVSAEAVQSDKKFRSSLMGFRLALVPEK